MNEEMKNLLDMLNEEKAFVEKKIDEKKVKDDTMFILLGMNLAFSKCINFIEEICGSD